MTASSRRIARELERRRTFAIISHPDAGKTTLTERLLLLGGAVREAGAVRARKAGRHATSDWLELEKQRGISVSSSVMHFEHEGRCVNILDTPGHRDFSEDTFRTLCAADSAVMLIDAAKGVEAQTRKLFEVCRLRGIPIFTFVNKMDRPGRDPLNLLDEIEEVLGIEGVPVNWPVDEGRGFAGLYDRLAERLLLFDGSGEGEGRVVAGPPDSEAVQQALGRAAEPVLEHLHLLDGAGAGFDREAVRAGRQTPVFFGSALGGRGVLPFLEHFLALAPPPGPRSSDRGPIDPVAEPFSGFVFKIQANMDPDHRDRVAFVRVCSGRFERGAVAVHAQSGKRLRLSRSTLVQAREREEVDEAWPGDVVALFDPGVFRIGDTVSETGEFCYAPLPTFPPEQFVHVELGEIRNRKALAKGLEQLSQEGVVQLFREPGGGLNIVLGAIGALQLDVLRHRLQTEYRVDVRLSPLPFELACWPKQPLGPDVLRWRDSAKRLVDRDGRTVVLLRSSWHLEKLRADHPELDFASLPPSAPGAAWADPAQRADPADEG